MIYCITDIYTAQCADLSHLRPTPVPLPSHFRILSSPSCPTSVPPVPLPSYTPFPLWAMMWSWALRCFGGRHAKGLPVLMLGVRKRG